MGWWLDINPAALEHREVDGHFDAIRQMYDCLIKDDAEEELASQGASYAQKEMQIRRIQRALAGKTIPEIAKEDHVGEVPVRASIRYALARLAILARDDQL